MKREHGGNIYKYENKMYDFSANLNPLGMPEGIKKTIIDNIDSYEPYPDPCSRQLCRALAKHHGVDPQQITCGNGAEEVIYRIICALKPKRALLIVPTFSEYEEALETFGCDINYFYLEDEKDFALTEEVISDIDTGNYDMVFLCNPNNPTGIPVGQKTVMSIIYACSKTGAKLVIDECFIEFILNYEAYSVMEKISLLPDVIILKSFTKMYSMAGIRLGYCVCGDSKVAEEIRECLTRWPVSTVAAKAGIAALKEEGHVERTRTFVAVEREKMIAGLLPLGLKLYSSSANYLFFRSKVKLDDALLEKGIMIRNCSNYEGIFQSEVSCRYYYRVAVRTANENRYLTEKLTEILG
ncbi:MAG: aminotransferase class I/II-fold pyridoxal phosphate-dependent enzyme [Hornefia sp.]|nr:aminotransferase class I/II-fold pyridoxal phosphate-dependent enzyme [Hornefia sp.]